MRMRLTIIGSSPAWPNPGGVQSGYLLEGASHPGAGKLLLDCGPGVLARLRQTADVGVDAIAITHFHLDHWGDLVPWAWFRAYAQGQVGPPPELWVPSGGLDELATFASYWGLPKMFDTAFAIREYVADESFQSLPSILPLFQTRVHVGAQARLVDLKWTSCGRPVLEQTWWKPRLDIQPR